MTKNEFQKLRAYWIAKINRPTVQAQGRKLVKSIAAGTKQILSKSHVKSLNVENLQLRGEYKTLQPYSFIPYPKDEPEPEKPFKNFNSSKVTIKKPKEHGQYVLCPKFSNNYPDSENRMIN